MAILAASVSANAQSSSSSEDDVLLMKLKDSYSQDGFFQLADFFNMDDLID